MDKVLKIFIPVVVLITVFLLGIHSWQSSVKEKVSDLKCPSQFATAEEAAGSFKTFSDDYYTAHPQASTADILNARVDFYSSHHCTQELEAYKQAQEGRADPATMAKIDAAIEASTEKP